MRGMWIDEDKTMLDISDHNLVRAWFKIGIIKTQKQVKKKRNEIVWISREKVKIDQCVKNFKMKIGKKHSFKKCMSKIKSSVDCTMKKRLKKRHYGKKKIIMKAAPWVDAELLENIDLRSKVKTENILGLSLILKSSNFFRNQAD